MSLEYGENAGDADAVAPLPPRQAVYRFCAVAQFVGFVVRVERQGDGEPRAILPDLGAQPASRSYPVDPAAPFLLGPLPRLQRVLFHLHLFSFSGSSRQDKRSAADCLTGRGMSCAVR